ncbi:MAG: hypothetical protein C5B59_14120 [Bacteroidetes bacterium]|nr:MAG: hypothetical protein C5B59_14120 [Bacteroidota bacterium]
MKKLRIFLVTFCWILTLEVILIDLGVRSDWGVWGKYVVALVFAALWTFLFQRRLQRERAS